MCEMESRVVDYPRHLLVSILQGRSSYCPPLEEVPQAEDVHECAGEDNSLIVRS